MTTTQLQPLAKKSLENQAVDSLRDYLLSGAVRPGARLTEIALAQQLGIARATLRTSLHRLASEGILVQIPYTGWQVAALSADDVRELWTLRGSLERLATRLVAQSGDPAVAQGVRKAYEALAEACEQGDMRRISERDYELHMAIIELSGHAMLKKHYRMLHHQVRLFISTSNEAVAEGPRDVLEQHRPIVEAILSGDVARAEQEAWHHSEAEGNRLFEWLSRRESKG